MDAMLISALARKAGVNVETIRYYERRGLLSRPPRPAEGYRRYPPEALNRLRFIKSAQGLGFTLKEIKELLALGTGGDAGCPDVLGIAQQKIRQIEEKIRSLESMHRALVELAESCPGEGGLFRCPIWESMELR
ncbi:MAG: MerR family transcriptional regulator [Deltaproteobacteria bacterium]|nr:MerR family transcriptional regulator [Deltaproteobacteria bacterium]MBW2309210.1 MerR family transcriptional regulator [Deltaproteobacteria bacterium]